MLAESSFRTRKTAPYREERDALALKINRLETRVAELEAETDALRQTAQTLDHEVAARERRIIGQREALRVGESHAATLQQTIDHANATIVQSIKFSHLILGRGERHCH
jgi:chromosome segregation ATPase